MLYDGYQRLGTGGVWGSARLDCAGWYSEEEVSGRICRWGDCWSVAVNVDSLKFGRSTCGAGGHRGWLASWPRTPGNIWEPKALSARETHLQSGGGLSLLAGAAAGSGQSVPALAGIRLLSCCPARCFSQLSLFAC